VYELSVDSELYYDNVGGGFILIQPNNSIPVIYYDLSSCLIEIFHKIRRLSFGLVHDREYRFSDFQVV